LIALVLISLAALLAERQRRDELGRVKTTDEGPSFLERCYQLAELLRAEYHPKQRAFCRSKAKRRWAKCTRRAGKSRGCLRESLARALERPNFRAIYCHATRAEARRIAWRSDTRDGWRNLIEQLGLRVATTRKQFDKDSRTDVLINEGELTIDFRNGSQLAIFAFDRAEDSDKIRGGEKDLVWVDEAQLVPDLRYFVEDVCEGLLAKPRGEAGELWLTGTPSRTLSGLFFDVSKEPEQGEREAGWEGHEFTVKDNPYFGSTEQERWESTGGEVLRKKGWDPKNPPPQFVREWGGKWTTGDALYVYAVHARPPHLFAPARVDRETGRYDHATAMRDLPTFITNASGRQEVIEWYFGLGVDIGFRPDPFAWVLWAWSPQIADMYEMGSWKKTELIPDRMKDVLARIYEQVGDRLVGFRGDTGGAGASSMIAGWVEQWNLPIEAADKHEKGVWIELYNGEVYARRIHYRIGSVLLAEQRELQWRELKSGERKEHAKRRVKDPATGEEYVPGNHCCDAGLYSYRDAVGRRLTFPEPPATPEERDAIEEREIHRSMNRAFERHQQQGAYDDE
jgi:hypothetical protein